MIDDIVIDALYNAWSDGIIECTKNFDDVNNLMEYIKKNLGIDKKIDDMITLVVCEHERSAFIDGFRMCISLIRGVNKI